MNNNKKWTPEMDHRLKELYPYNTNVQIAKILNMTEGAVGARGFILRLFKDKQFLYECSKKGFFQKGQVPYNKGKKLDEFMSKEAQEKLFQTTFKAGHMPHNYLPVGTEILMKKDGYIKVKIADPKKWKLKHRLVWQQHHGKIPKGYNVQFHDGDRTNCAIDNLFLITREEQVINNSIIRYPVELRTAIKRVAKLKRLIKQKTNN